MKRFFMFLTVTAMAIFALGHGSIHHHGMADDMPMTVESELDFLREMIPHHQEAVDSAQLVFARSERPEMRAFAQEMIRMQAGEIGLIQARSS